MDDKTVDNDNKNQLRADSSLKEKRVLKIYTWIMQGYSMRKMLFQLISEEKELFQNEMTERHMDNYIADARKLLSEKMSDDADYEKNLALNRLEALYTMNYKIHDFRECRSTIMDKAKLLGILIDKKDVTSGGEKLKKEIDLSKLSNEVLESLIEAQNKDEV